MGMHLSFHLFCLLLPILLMQLHLMFLALQCTHFLSSSPVYEQFVYLSCPCDDCPFWCQWHGHPHPDHRVHLLNSRVEVPWTMTQSHSCTSMNEPNWLHSCSTSNSYNHSATATWTSTSVCLRLHTLSSTSQHLNVCFDVFWSIIKLVHNTFHLPYFQLLRGLYQAPLATLDLSICRLINYTTTLHVRTLTQSSRTTISVMVTTTVHLT